MYGQEAIVSFFNHHPMPWYHEEVVRGCEDEVRDTNGVIVTKMEMVMFISMVHLEMELENCRQNENLD